MVVKRHIPYADKGDVSKQFNRPFWDLADSSHKKFTENEGGSAKMSPWEQKLGRVLKYLDREYGIKTLYYPGSGCHQTPKEALGKDKVVHLSFEKDAERATGVGYLAKLGEGIKVKGDYRYSPFKDKSFDAVLIHGTPLASTIEALREYRRVVKDDGLIIVTLDRQICSEDMPDSKIIAKYLGDSFYPGGPHLERIFMPPEIETFGDTLVQVPTCPYKLKLGSPVKSSPPDVVVFKNIATKPYLERQLPSASHAPLPQP